MPKIITIANQKGGVGKSTLSLSLACCFSNNLKVGLVDTDLQGSLCKLDLVANGIELIPFIDNIDELPSKTCDIIIIDTPPYLSSKLPDIFSFSDFILIPTKAGLFDLMAIKSTLHMVKEANMKKNSLKAGIVLNMVKHNSSISSEFKGVIDNDSIPLLKSSITERVSYTRSLINGGIFNSYDEKAKDEIVSLADEILNIMGF